MESEQDIVDLTIKEDDDCLSPTELSEMANCFLKMDGMEGNKETAKNHEDDTLSVYGSEDGESVYGSEEGEIMTDEEEEKEEGKQENNFQENFSKFQIKAKKNNVSICCILCLLMQT